MLVTEHFTSIIQVEQVFPHSSVISKRKQSHELKWTSKPAEFNVLEPNNTYVTKAAQTAATLRTVYVNSGSLILNGTRNHNYVANRRFKKPSLATSVR